CVHRARSDRADRHTANATVSLAVPARLGIVGSLSYRPVLVFLVITAIPDSSLARAVVHRALDLGPELDVAAQEVVVLLAERLGVAALAGLDPPGLGELVEQVEELLGIGECLEEGAGAGGLDEVDAAVGAGGDEGEHDGLGVLVADRADDGAR